MCDKTLYLTGAAEIVCNKLGSYPLISTAFLYATDDPCMEKNCEGECVVKSEMAECCCPLGQTVDPTNDTACIGILFADCTS